MKTESITKPTEKFKINYYDKYEKCTIKFNDIENIEEEQRQFNNEEIQTFYTYDTYTIKTWYRNNLQEDIETNYQTWLNFAKNQEYNEYAKIVRDKRDHLLQETDKEMVLDRLKLNMPEDLNIANIVDGIKVFFTSLKDIFNSDMAKYRQALRDIPQQERFSIQCGIP